MRLTQLIETGVTRAVRPDGMVVDLTVGSFNYEELLAADWEPAPIRTATITREQFAAAFNAVVPPGGSIARAPGGRFFTNLCDRLGI